MITATRTSAATPSVLRSTVEDEGIDDLIAVGLSLHLFTELVREHLDLADTDLHRATTVLTKQVIDTLARQLTTGKDPLEAIQRLITDPARRAHPDGRTAEELCGAAWSAACRCCGSPPPAPSPSRRRGGARRRGGRGSSATSPPARSSTSP
jgi:hypothetical protein